MGLPRRWSRSLLSGTTSGLDDGCTRVVVNEYRVVHEYKVVHKYGVVHERYTRLRSGARVVHEITEWCRRTSGARVVNESTE